MAVEIIEEPVSALPEYGEVPIAFRVTSHFEIAPINQGLGGLKFVEKAVVPYVKDYDANECDRPAQWPKRFDMSHWGIIAAFEGRQRAGGVAIAWKTRELDLLEGRDELAWLWDLRVHPDYRGQGVGHRLFGHAVSWARERQCTVLMVETQNINVPACRFYVRQGFELRVVNQHAYKKSDETQLLWYRDLDR